MRATASRFAVPILLAFSAFAQVAVAQSLDRVFHFTQTGTVEEARKIANVIRAMTAISQVSVNEEPGTLTVHGTVEQVALAERLFLDLDKPAWDAASREYEMQDSSSGSLT